MRTVVLSILFGWSLLGYSLFASADTSFPFGNVGEELEYELKWGVFHVGTGYLRILEPKEINGERCFHIMLEVRTNGFADAVYKVRSRYESFISMEHLRPVQYLAFQREGKTRRNGVLLFDWEAGTATYQRDEREPLEPVEIVAGTWDPLSVTYAFRRLLQMGDLDGSLYACDGRKCLNIEIQLDRNHHWEGAGFVSEAIRIKPDTKDLRGVFQKSRDSNIKMSFSKDAHAYPLIIRSKVIVGSFEARLKRVELKVEDPLLLFEKEVESEMGQDE